MTASIGDRNSQEHHSVGLIGSNAPADVRGFERFLSAETVRKVLRKHGVGGTNNDQVPIRPSDFEHIGEITGKGRWTEKTERSGRRTIEYRHKLGGHEYLYVEVVGAKNSRVIAKSFYVPRK